VASSAPLALHNAFLGAGCALDTPPTLYAAGSPAQATLGNTSFTIVSAGNVPAQPSFLRYSTTPGSQMLQSCTLWFGGSLANACMVSAVSSDGSGVATHPAAIPNDVAFEGVDVRLQAISRDPGNGPLFHSYELSDALLVRVGNLQPDCP